MRTSNGDTRSLDYMSYWDDVGIVFALSPLSTNRTKAKFRATGANVPKSSVKGEVASAAPSPSPYTLCGC